MELKIVCGCGQKIAFDVEPVNGRMPVKAACPSCGADGTETANNILAQHFPNRPAPIPVMLSAQSVMAPASPTPPPIRGTPRPIAPIGPVVKSAAKPSKEFSMGLGILGAFAGAALGAALMIGFYQWVGFRFPLTGVGAGALSGYGARLLGRGTHTTLGIISGALALVSILGVFYWMYGEFAFFNIISIVICVGVAYRLAS